MGSPTYAQNKKFIYNYRLKNMDKIREITKIQKRRYDAWKKIQKVYLGILLI